MCYQPVWILLKIDMSLRHASRVLIHTTPLCACSWDEKVGQGYVLVYLIRNKLNGMWPWIYENCTWQEKYNQNIAYFTKYCPTFSSREHRLEQYCRTVGVCIYSQWTLSRRQHMMSSETKHKEIMCTRKVTWQLCKWEKGRKVGGRW